MSEGLALRRVGVESPILLLGPSAPAETRALVRARLIPLVWDQSQVERLAGAARADGVRLSVHLKVDTGMARWGVSPEAVPALAQAIKMCESLSLDGVASHFATADEAESRFARAQLERFLNVCREQPPGLTRHISNSAALFAIPGAALDLVRVGLAMYGISPFPDRRPGDLRPVLTWKSWVAALRELPTGQSVGYGRHFTARRPSQIAVVPVGYGDGLPWRTEGGAMLVSGHRAPLVGRVSMDSSFIDVTDVPEVRAGDEVVVLGTQGNEVLTAWDWARWSRTIPYAILTGIGQRVARLPGRAPSLTGPRP